MENLAQKLMLEMTAPRAWLLSLLLPLFLVVACRLAGRAKRAGKWQQLEHGDGDHLLPPHSPPALPVLGHLHLIGSLLHVSLRRLAMEHGPDLMLLRLGAMPVVVASSPRAAEAVLRTHDHVLASRPPQLSAEIVLYGPSTVGFSPYGEYWRQAKKLVTTHLLSAKKVRSFRHAREEEVSMVMSQIGAAAAAGAAVDVTQLLGTFTNDLACRGVMGRSFRSEGRNKLFKQLVADTASVVVGFNVEEFFPFLARFGVLSKAVRAKSERLRRRWDELLDKLIQDHEGKYYGGGETAASYPKDDEEDDFVHVLLSVREEYGLNKEQMKGILLDAFFGGEGTASLLEFTMAELMRRPEAMKKLQAEVRRSVPEGEEAIAVITELNLADAAYLRAVIKESLRLHPVSPLIALHFSMAGCAVDGHAIPAGVRVVVNAWAMGRDARLWEDAEEFVPERFAAGGAAAEVSFRGNDFQFLPFGAGRRMCPGINSAMAAVELVLVNLVHRFDWELPRGREGRDVDMSEEFGLFMHLKEKLVLVPKLRT
ncbi:hypothetical protein ACP4OV_004455 [Aristida adscensionis]